MKILLTLVLCLMLSNFVVANEPSRHKVQSITQKNIRQFEKVQESFDAGRFEEVTEYLDLMKVTELNNIERAYLYSFYGSVFFEKKDYSLATEAFEKSIQREEGLPPNYFKKIRDVMIPKSKLAARKQEESSNDYEKLRGLLSEPVSTPLNEPHLVLAKAAYQLEKIDELNLLIQRAENSFGATSLPKEWFNIRTDVLVDREVDIDKKIELRKLQAAKYPAREAWLYLLDLYALRENNKKPETNLGHKKQQVDPNLMATLDQIYQSKFMQTADEYTVYMKFLFVEKRYDDLTRVYLEADGEVDLEPTVAITRMYGRALFETKQWAKSIEEHKKLIQLGRDYTGVLQIRVGVAHQELGYFDEASVAYKAAKKIKRSKDEAKQKLKELRKAKREARKRNF